MKDISSLSSTFVAVLFAASLLFAGCAGNLTGPQPEATEKPVYEVDSRQGSQAGHNNDNEGGTTRTGASHNTADS
jgi:hypothetical protein